MKKKYKMSDKRKSRDLRLANWDRRLQILNLRASGLTFAAIGKRLGVTRQCVNANWHKIKDMTVEEAESIANSLE